MQESGKFVSAEATLGAWLDILSNEPLAYVDGKFKELPTSVVVTTFIGLLLGFNETTV